jgi:hypothetical protein
MGKGSWVTYLWQSDVRNHDGIEGAWRVYRRPIYIVVWMIFVFPGRSLVAIFLGLAVRDCGYGGVVTAGRGLNWSSVNDCKKGIRSSEYIPNRQPAQPNTAAVMR